MDGWASATTTPDPEADPDPDPVAPLSHGKVKARSRGLGMEAGVAASELKSVGREIIVIYIYTHILKSIN